MTEDAIQPVESLLRHTAWLRALARSLVGAAAADDLVQETFIAALRSPPAAERPARPWLARVMCNLTRMRYRTDSRRARREAQVGAPAAVPSTPEQLLARVEMDRMVC